MSVLIEARELCKSYQRGRGKSAVRCQALSAIDFKVEPGEAVALLGRSGSGKSTLLNLLAGLDRPTSGELKVGDCELSKCDKQALDAYRRKTVGIVFQQFRLIKHKSAFHNVALPLMFAGLRRRERARRVQECLELVGLADRKEHRPYELSGGEQQRVAVARAISHAPPLLLADEPTGNLDSKNAEIILELIFKAKHEAQATLLLITHDEGLAHKYFSRVIRLHDGSIL